jgi:hypothetical protein
MKNLKFLFLICLISFITLTTAKSQIQLEPKINPLALILSGDLVLGCELIMSDKFGVEPVIDFGKSDIGLDFTGGSEEISFTGFGIRAIGKYYFNPNRGADKFYVGPYFKYKGGAGTVESTDEKITRTRIAAGLAIGYKVVSASGIVFEIGLGGGRAFTDTFKNKDTDEEISVTDLINIDFLGRLALGYRFGGGSASSSTRGGNSRSSSTSRKRR